VVNGKPIVSSDDVLAVLQITQKLPEIPDRDGPLGPTVASVDVILGEHLDTSCLYSATLRRLSTSLNGWRAASEWRTR
jgi:hypothetical protein